MDFNSLVGQTLPFYGVDNCCFKIGEHVFEALENEDDGYRSYLGSVEVKDPTGLIFFRTPVATVEVVEDDAGTKDSYGVFEGYALVDTVTRHKWLVFGTQDCDDYYPCFMFSYQPRKEIT